MSDTTEAPTPLRPLKTWSHLTGQRRRPSEYEIVSTNLLWHTRESDQLWEVGGPTGLHDGLVHPLPGQQPRPARGLGRLPGPGRARVPDVQHPPGRPGDLRRRPPRAVLRRGARRQPARARGSPTLAQLYTPGRYLLHTVQMASSYLVHIPPTSTIGNCAAFQAADAFRWVSRTAYRTRELSIAHPGAGFGETERRMWEELPAWQGFRELMEKALVAYDWAESVPGPERGGQAGHRRGVAAPARRSARRSDDLAAGPAGRRRPARQRTVPPVDGGAGRDDAPGRQPGRSSKAGWAGGCRSARRP